jgi:membrane peptidoglycan carboxypeptidase
MEAPRGTRRRHRRLRLLGAGVLATVVLVLAGLVLGLALAPSVDDLQQRVDRALADHHSARVSIDRVPDSLKNALIAIEDERFYEHHGIDSQGLVRALLSDLYHRRALEGGSTLTQQLVKLLYLGGDDNAFRKIGDILLALKVEAHYSKAEILESYLNTVYFGHGAWGVGAASQTYFGVSPGELDLARASMLAGLPQSPSYYDLYRNPCAARARQFAVLAQMARDGYIDSAQEKAAFAEPIGYPCK